MRTLSPKSSLIRYWEELVYLEAALLADEETAPLAAPVTATLESFGEIRDVDLDTRRGLIQARARASVADAKLDEGLREVHVNTLHLVGQDRERKEYRTLFPGALTVHIRHALAKQVEVARETVDKLGLSLFEKTFRALQLALLAPLIDKGEAVLNERKQAELGRVEGRLEIETWKEEVNAVRLSVYADLLARASNARRKRSWAETFFPRASARSARGEADEQAEVAEVEADEADEAE